jgi:hypothetical protein
MDSPEKSLLQATLDYLSHAQHPVHVSDLCERLAEQLPAPPTPAVLHALLRLDPRFEQRDRYRWCLAPPSEHIPSLSQIADRIVHHIRKQGKRFLSEQALASMLAGDYNLSPVESLQLVREASAAYVARIPRAGANVFLAEEES